MRSSMRAEAGSLALVSLGVGIVRVDDPRSRPMPWVTLGADDVGSTEEDTCTGGWEGASACPAELVMRRINTIVRDAAVLLIDDLRAVTSD
jgi:hypothetical protein